MLQKLINFILGKKTTASVMSQFNKTLSDLRAVELEHKKKAEEAAVEALQAQAALSAAKDEAAAAASVAKRLESLIGSAVVENEGFVTV